MAAVINPTITDAGLAAAIAQAGNGLQLAITHIALGTGQYTPSSAQSAMINRKEKVAIAGGIVSGAGSFRLSVLFASWTGTAYSACEIGFYAGDPDAGGILFAVYSASSGLIVSRTNIDYVASFAMQLTRVPAGSVTITVDTNLSQAMAQLNLHLGEVNPHIQYVRHDAPQGLSATAKNQGRRNLNVGTGGNHTSFIVGTTQSLNIEQAGLVTLDAGSGSITLYLPPASTMPDMPFRFVRVDNNYAATVTVIRAGADWLSWLGVASASSFTLGPSDYREIVANGGTAWFTTSSRDDGMSAGDVVLVCGSTPRPGTIKANGALLSRALYPRLFQKAVSVGLISEADWAAGWNGRYTAGDGSSTFRIPDLRGEFLRCWDDGRGLDAGREYGNVQGSNNISHTHTGSSDAQGWHGHSGSTYAAGSHAHGVYDPGHSHTVTQEGGRATQSAYQNGPNSPFRGDVDTLLYTSGVGTGIGIYADGSHAHSFDTAGAGTHSHNVSVTASGGNEARPRNVAMLACIKF